MRLLYFAWVKEKAGIAAEEVAPPEGARAEVIRAAIDHRHVRHDARIAGAREIAFFPPVTGG